MHFLPRYCLLFILRKINISFRPCASNRWLRDHTSSRATGSYTGNYCNYSWRNTYLYCDKSRKIGAPWGLFNYQESIGKWNELESGESNRELPNCNAGNESIRISNRKHVDICSISNCKFSYALLRSSSKYDSSCMGWYSKRYFICRASI